MDALLPLTIEEKRQAVYSSLYRYSAEAIPLRQRALHRVVLGALIGSSQSNPFRIGRIQENLFLGSQNLRIRNEIIQEAVDQLIGEEKIEHILVRDRHAYFLSPKGEAEISDLTVSSVKLFQEVCDHLFGDTAGFLSYNIASQIFRKFAFECFARFGLQIAKSTTGTTNREELIMGTDARTAFEAAINGFQLTHDQRESLEVRCHIFLTSSERYYERLKFYLTQGYYFTQLIGLEHAKFNPLAEQAFAKSVFYLDTNVLLVGLLYSHDDGPQFIEMLKLAQRLGIEVRVSRATIHETQNVIADRIKQIERIVNVLPNKLAERTNDQILMAFYETRTDNPDITPGEFFKPFQDLEPKLKSEWNIEIDQREALQIINGRDIEEMKVIMNEEAEKNRGFGKSQSVLEHDAAHYLAVMDERSTNNKAWFLSRDRSLEAVSVRLNPNEPSFSFSHIGFLQSISPFVTSPNEEVSLADVMSAFISDQIRPFETLFDISELALMAEFHEDVMSTPVDQLIMAFDYIKSRTLRGKPYQEKDIPKVSLELKKFLSADRDKQFEALEQERLRLSEEAMREKELRIASELKADIATQRSIELEEEVLTLRNDLSQTHNEVVAIKKILDYQTMKSAGQRQRNRLIGAIIGIILGLILLHWQTFLIVSLISQVPSIFSWKDFLVLLLRIVSALVIAIPLINFILKTKWPNKLQITIVTIISAITLGLTKIIPKETISVVSDLIDWGAIIAAIIVSIYFLRKKPST